MFARIVVSAVGILFGAAFGLAAGGILSAIIVTVLTAGSAIHGGPSVLDQAFASHPWGVVAWMVVFGEGVGASAGAGLGLWLGTRAWRGLPASLRERSGSAFVLFLLLEAVLCAIILPSALRLAFNHGTTTGQVRRLYPQEHGTVAYAYIVEGQSFERQGSPEHFAGLKPGDEVRVYYTLGDPGLSSLREPGGQLFAGVGGSLVLSSFASFWLLGLFSTLRRQIKPETGTTVSSTSTVARL